jgi:hypothetical protein
MACEEKIHIKDGPSWDRILDSFKYSFLDNGIVVPCWFLTPTGDEISLRFTSLSAGHFMSTFGGKASDKFSFEAVVQSTTVEIQGFRHLDDATPWFVDGWYNPYSREGEIWVPTEPF